MSLYGTLYMQVHVWGYQLKFLKKKGTIFGFQRDIQGQLYSLVEFKFGVGYLFRSEI